MYSTSSHSLSSLIDQLRSDEDRERYGKVIALSRNIQNRLSDLQSHRKTAHRIVKQPATRNSTSLTVIYSQIDVQGSLADPYRSSQCMEHYSPQLERFYRLLDRSSSLRKHVDRLSDQYSYTMSVGPVSHDDEKFADQMDGRAPIIREHSFWTATKPVVEKKSSMLISSISTSSSSCSSSSSSYGSTSSLRKEQSFHSIATQSAEKFARSSSSSAAFVEALEHKVDQYSEVHKQSADKGPDPCTTGTTIISHDDVLNNHMENTPPPSPHNDKVNTTACKKVFPKTLPFTPPASPKDTEMKHCPMKKSRFPPITVVEKKSHTLRDLIRRTSLLNNQITYTRSSIDDHPAVVTGMDCTSGEAKAVLKLTMSTLSSSTPKRQRNFGFTFQTSSAKRRVRHSAELTQKYIQASDPLVQEALASWLNLCTTWPSLQDASHILRDGAKIYVVYDRNLF